jgi:hypothetical protein
LSEFVGKQVVSAAKSKVGKQILTTVAKEALEKGLPALAGAAATALGQPELAPVASSLAGVVSCDSIRIALTHAALLDLPVMGADIRNAYLQAPSSEKHFIICGPEFEIENEGRVALIRRALYGGKVAGRNFWHHL